MRPSFFGGGHKATAVIHSRACCPRTASKGPANTGSTLVARIGVARGGCSRMRRNSRGHGSRSVTEGSDGSSEWSGYQLLQPAEGGAMTTSMYGGGPETDDFRRGGHSRVLEGALQARAAADVEGRAPGSLRWKRTRSSGAGVTRRRAYPVALAAPEGSSSPPWASLSRVCLTSPRAACPTRQWRAPDDS